jgi:ATP-binding cassette subfamily F protein 3
MIQLSNISKSYADQELFKDVNLRVNSGDKIGLVGRNGSGKSTLFKLILGEEHYDDGEILIPKNYKIGALKQHLEFTQATILDEVALSLAHDDKFSIYKVEKILFGLGFSADDLNKSPSSFSGGYQIRLNLAKLLITVPNMLLLDEPTNYLDIVSLRWLKNFLKKFDGEVIIITHDRDFMDSVCNHTMGLNAKQLFILKGNTYKFYDQINANNELHIKQKQNQDKKIKELQEFIAKNKARASTASLAQSKVKILEKMDILDDLQSEANLKFDFNFKNTSAKVLLEVKDLSFGYNSNDILFSNVSFNLKKGDVLGIIGKNGKGKSTLLNNIAKELKPLSGTIDYHISATFGHFGQTNLSHLNPNSTVMDEIYLSDPKMAESKVRTICGSMMFSANNAKKKINLLSGGEKSRVMLGQIIAKEVNILFLDEPTNHLDMYSIDALTDAIKNFDGAVIIVTHSEELLRQTANSLIVFQKDGANYYDYTYDEFLEKYGWEDEEDEQKEKIAPKINKKVNKKLRATLITQRNQELKDFKKTIQKCEDGIIELEDKLKPLQEELIVASNALDNSKVIELSSIIRENEQQIESMFEQLEVAQNSYDEIFTKYEQKLEDL